MNSHQFAAQGARRGMIVGGLAGAGIGAAVSGLPKHHYDQNGTRGTKRTKKDRIHAAIGGGVVGGAMGAHRGYISGWNSRVGKWTSGFRPPGWSEFGQREHVTKATMPGWARGAKNKADFKKKYHAHSRENHPDLTTDPTEKARRTEAMKHVNTQRDDYETLFKNAQVYALFNELSQICR